MEGNVWRPTHLTSEQMEERRLVAATLLRQGQLSQADIARHVGVSRASVCRWAATLAQEGPHGLAARPIPGPSPRLDEKAWTRLGRLLDRGPWRRALPPNGGRLGASPLSSSARSGCIIIPVTWNSPSKRMGLACSARPHGRGSAMSG
jgi:hypothetical protein